ncbi:MAG: serine/threonine-protein kinase, partial [Planctomycetota bacterium]
MTANDVCPDPGTLAKLIAGELSPDLEAKWVRHIDGCLLCQRELEQASSSIFNGPVHRLGKTSLNTTILAEVVNDAKSILQSDQRASWGDAWIGEISRNVQEVGFEFVRVLGKGGMGVVFLAFEASLNRNVAIKVLAPDMAEQDSARERFLREARAAAAVKHPNIITIHAVSDRARLPYLSMEYVEGRTLQQLIDGNRRLAVKQVIDVATQITKALSEAHAAGIVHRDIKPANILIEDGSGLVKVTDFGLAHSSGQAHLTRTGVIVGTPAFLAPEALDDRARYDGRGDLFSLGSVMFAMCYGVSPFESDSILKTLHKIESKPPPSIRERFKDVPAWLEDIIFKLLRKNPSERFQTGEEVLKALRQGEAGQATGFAPVIHPAKPTAGRKSNKKTKKKLPLAWVLVSSLAVFSLIVSAYALTREQSGMEDNSGVAARVPTKERYPSNERSQRRQLASDHESRQSRLRLPTQSPWFFIVENGAVVAELTTLEDAIEES